MIAFDNDVVSSSEPTSGSFLPVQRDVTDAINVRLGEPVTPGGVISGQTIMGIFVAIGP